MSMASIRPVNRDDIAEGFAPHAPSSGKGSHVLHNNPQAQSQKKTKKALATSRHSPSSARMPPQPSIQEGLATNRISSVSSGTEPHAIVLLSHKFFNQLKMPPQKVPLELEVHQTTKRSRGKVAELRKKSPGCSDVQEVETKAGTFDSKVLA